MRPEPLILIGDRVVVVADVTLDTPLGAYSLKGVEGIVTAMSQYSGAHRSCTVTFDGQLIPLGSASDVLVLERQSLWRNEEPNAD